MIATKPKACAHCGKPFTPRSSFHTVCKPACLLKQVNKAEREKKARAKLEKAQDRAKRESQKPLSKVRAPAQAAFNAYIRERDADLPCISCGETNPPMKHGGQWDAGHFMSRGAYPELRFDEDNCHKQCKGCNGGSKYPGKARTVAANYEERLIERIGAERVERLKGPHEIVKWDRETLRQIATIYRAKLRDLKKEQA